MRELRALSYASEAGSTGTVRALPMRVGAAAVVSALYARTRKRGRKLARLDVKELRRLRDAVRRLRCGLLFLEPLLPEARARALASTVEVLQETLGGINDCAVARELIALARAEARGPQRRKARKLLRKRVKATRKALELDLAGQWADFRAAEKSWSAPARA
jgi:CHAD domain-containing protein